MVRPKADTTSVRLKADTTHPYFTVEYTASMNMSVVHAPVVDP